MNRRTLKKILIAVTIVILAAGGLYWWNQSSGETTPASVKKDAPKVESGIPVQIATAKKESVPQYLAGLGTVTAVSTVALRSQVDGELIALHFREGDQVKAGQLLAELDPRPWQVSLKQAQGQLARSQATLTNARRDLVRYEKLAKTGLASQQDLDAQRAKVSELQGTIQADEASVASAQLNLTWSRITAPVAGRVGLKKVDIGNYVSKGDSDGIVVITQTHPIDVIFSLPESHIGSILRAQKRTELVPVEAWDRGSQVRLSSGKLLSLDNQIDPQTGTVKLKARFDNSDDILFPNQFVNIRMKIDTLEDAVTIPVSALQMSNEGYFVWVVNNDNKVSKKRVTSGIRYKQLVVITDGLAPGVRVVTDGLDKLTEGSVVETVAAYTASSDDAVQGEQR